MGWKDRAVSVDQKSSWRDRAIPAEVSGPKPSQLEAGLRGAAQGASFGLEDELAGVGGALGSKLGMMGVDKVESTHPEVQAKMDALVPPEKSLGDLYRESRDEERVINRAAEEAHPGTYFTGNVAGAVANPLSKVGTSLKGALGLGAAQGLGSSDADLTKGEFKDAAVDTAIGTGAGAVGFGLGKAIPKAASVAGWAGKKALTNLGPTGEAIAARLAGRAQDTARSYPQLAEDMGKTLKGLGEKTGELDAEAWKTLSREAEIPKITVTHSLDEALNVLKLKGKPPKPPGVGDLAIERFERDMPVQKAKDVLLGDTDKQVSATLSRLKSDIKGLPDNLSETDIKTIIKKLDDNINWDDQSQNKLNEVLEGIRTKFDEALKFRNPAYKKAMEPVAERTGLLKDLKRQFNFRNVPGDGLQPSDATASNIQSSLRENKAVTQGNLEKLKGFTGQDYSDLAKDYQLAKQFDVKPPNASTKKSFIGGALGSLAGGPLGAGAGAVAGGSMDAYGGKVAGKIIDTYLKATNSNAFGKFTPVIERAIKDGPRALAVTSSILSKNPEFRELMGLDAEVPPTEVTTPNRKLGSIGKKHGR